MQQIPADPYVTYIEKIKSFGGILENPNRAWKQMKRDFRSAYMPSGEIGLYPHMLKAGVAIDETKAFYNRKLISYMYSKDVFDKSGLNVGGAVLLGKTVAEKYLTRLTKCTHRELLTELKNSTNLFASKNIKVNPYELIIDLDAIAGINNIKNPRKVYIQWVESLISTGEYK